MPSATPTVFVETGKKVGLDDDDLKQVGEIVYFGDAVLTTAKLTVNGKDTTSATVSDRAEFTYQSVDQNGKHYFDKEFLVTFQLETTFSGATVYAADGTTVLGTVNQGSMESNKFVRNTQNGKATIFVEAGNGTTVTVNASGGSFANQTASATFNKVTNEGIAPGQQVHGKVVAVDKDNNRILLSDSKGETIYELSYADAELYIKGVAHLESTFEDGPNSLSVGDELLFTQATDTTKAKFDNKDVNITNSLKIKENAKVVLSFENSEYDFDGQILGDAATKAAKVEIQGNNVTLKNLILEGDLEVTSKVTADATLDKVTVSGVTTVNGGAKFKVKNNSNLGVVILNVKEEVELTNSAIAELVAKVTGSKVTGTGTITTLSAPADVTAPTVDSTVTVSNRAAEVPFTATTTSGDTVTLTFTAGTNATNITSTPGTVGAGTTADTATITFANAAGKTFEVKFTQNGVVKTYTVVAGSLGNTATITRKY
ncbi:hypothetical protein ACIQVU_19460 [Lysinibacillus sp. NPDC098008]|uniref:hypothetical protein n=1 Tax=Lysinibacillus sp. NPDC098008 TaxID=3364146 RepID=UPI003819BA56